MFFSPQYLDTQHIHNLTTYLQALHRTGSATADHTSLLLNCYTRLRDTQQLNEFIMVRHSARCCGHGQTEAGAAGDIKS